MKTITFEAGMQQLSLKLQLDCYCIKNPALQYLAGFEILPEQLIRKLINIA